MNADQRLTANQPVPDRWQILAGLLVLLYVATLNFMFQANLNTVREPPLLLPILNTIFAALIPIAVAIIAARAYLSSGLNNLLFKGCGMRDAGLRLWGAIGGVAYRWSTGSKYERYHLQHRRTAGCNV